MSPQLHPLETCPDPSPQQHAGDLQSPCISLQQSECPVPVTAARVWPQGAEYAVPKGRAIKQTHKVVTTKRRDIGRILQSILLSCDWFVQSQYFRQQRSRICRLSFSWESVHSSPDFAREERTVPPLVFFLITRGCQIVMSMLHLPESCSRNRR